MLSDELREHLLDLAEEQGVDADELLAAAEAEITGQRDDSSPAVGMGAFEAHTYPYLRVNEIRARLGVEPVDDGQLYAGEWLVKHGGGLVTSRETE